MEYVKLPDLEIDEEVIAMLPGEYARDNKCLPLFLRDEGETVVVAIADPLNVTITDNLRLLLDRNVEAVVANEDDIVDYIDQYYSHSEDIDKLMEELEQDGGIVTATSGTEFDLDPEALSHAPPVIKTREPHPHEGSQRQGIGPSYRTVRNNPPNPVPSRRRAPRNRTSTKIPPARTHLASQSYGEHEYRRNKETSRRPYPTYPPGKRSRPPCLEPADSSRRIARDAYSRQRNDDGRYRSDRYDKVCPRSIPPYL